MADVKSPYQNAPAATPTDFPVQHQERQPGRQQQMNPQPVTDNPAARGSGKLQGRVAVITGGDSGIGQAVADAFAKEGADIVIAYLEEQEDADRTCEMVKAAGRRCTAVKCDLRQELCAKQVIDQTISDFGRIDLLVNNIAVQFPQNEIGQISSEQLKNTFETNFFSCFYMVQAALPHMGQGCSIINTTSITAYQGSPTLIDYSATKGAIVSFTRSLSQSLAPKGIRVNAVAPGPVWTPLIPSSFDGQRVSEFGKNMPLGRAAQPFEIAPAYVYLASDDSACMTGQVLHVNCGAITES
ncbi:SDR family oxidoreductase [Caproiciproducens sp. NJN-50]|uniref:SDR family oxidoreductase n=1 Tax=Acutalibacteraceae TaxID=3082771 RepID=UPI000FFE2EBB|nr:MULTISPECIES: SDR family oxidoreductase [Acutalibacteraceae]QAT49344.1 SDR family oxidoreductase [Caproiciproducens sp. NJN-50]